MKESRDLKAATEARIAARAALRDTSAKLRGRLAPRLLAADVAEIIAARASRIFLKRRITRKRRVLAATAAGAAIATAIVLRAMQKRAPKKIGDLPTE